jgi:hypothetical protein
MPRSMPWPAPRRRRRRRPRHRFSRFRHFSRPSSRPATSNRSSRRGQCTVFLKANRPGSPLSCFHRLRAAAVARKSALGGLRRRYTIHLMNAVLPQARGAPGRRARSADPGRIITGANGGAAWGGGAAATAPLHVNGLAACNRQHFANYTANSLHFGAGRPVRQSIWVLAALGPF